MGTEDLIQKIEQLPIPQRILLIERALRSIRESEAKSSLENAANALLKDYKTDKDLTAFTAIDFENFYEAR